MKLEILGPGPKSLGLRPLGLYIKDALTKIKQNGELYIVAALSDIDGINLLKNHIRRISRHNGTTKAVIGIDLGVTKDVLNKAIRTFGAGNIFVYKNPADSVFHPKMYLIKLDESSGIVILGSSNLTGSGFFKNFEINLAIELDLRKARESKIFEQFYELFWKLTKEKSSQELTKNLALALVSNSRLKSQTLIMSRSIKPPKLSNLFKGEKHGWEIAELKGKNTFLMTLSYNDVSGARIGDKYIRIPLLACKANPSFWGWTKLFRHSRKGHPERFIKIRYKGKTTTCRLYFVKTPDELRLVFPQIYGLGKKFVHSILKISRKKAVYEVELIRKSSTEYNKYLRWCSETCPRGKASIPKRWGYL